MTHLEIEAKFKVEDIDRLKSRLLELGLKSSGEELQHSIVFDYPDGRFRKDWTVFRLRKNGDKGRITFKEPDEGKLASVRKEIEIKVSDFENTKHIIRKLGFVESFVYEKFRENFFGEGFVISVDRNPFIGNYFEIEAGSEDRFMEVMKILGLNKEDVIKDNYRQVFEEYCRQKNINVNNMTFEEEKALKSK